MYQTEFSLPFHFFTVCIFGISLSFVCMYYALTYATAQYSIKWSLYSWGHSPFEDMRLHILNLSVHFCFFLHTVNTLVAKNSLYSVNALEFELHTDVCASIKQSPLITSLKSRKPVKHFNYPPMYSNMQAHTKALPKSSNQSGLSSLP